MPDEVVVSIRAQVLAASQKLDAWIEEQNFKGWDPFDALNSSLLKRLTFGNRRLGQIWVQLLKRSHINLRPLLGVRKEYNPKGMGLFLASYLRKYKIDLSNKHAERVRFFASWLLDHISPGYHGACWGYPFDWPNRDFFAKAGTPTIVNTGFVGLSFVDLHLSDNEFGVSQDALSISESSCNFVLNDLNRYEVGNDELCFSYTPIDKRWIHNANLLGAWLLAATSACNENARFAQAARASANYSVRRQRSEGWWPYGEDKKEGWVDNFHTGFVLLALRNIGYLLKTTDFEKAAQKGYLFWKNNFFLSDGTPKYYPERISPTDIHCASQAILTFLSFRDVDSEAQELADRTASWAIRNMQSQQGYFYYQKRNYFQNKIPYMRWSEAWMQRALTEIEYQKWKE